MTTHTGSCHCGQVRFEVEGEIDGALDCNCSICRRKGSLLWFAPREALRVTAGADALATYTFNRHLIAHRFCPTCGIHPFGEGTAPDGKAMAAINLRCVDGLDLAALPVRHFDGASA
jgi:hypothetical protein